MRATRHPPFSFASSPLPPGNTPAVRGWLGIAWAAVALLLASCAADEAAPKTPIPTVNTQNSARFERIHRAMGTTFRLVLFASSEAQANRGAHAAWQRVDALEAVATDYDPESEARLLGERANQWVPISSDLALVLRASEAAWRRSGGAFDPTVGAWSKLWRRALRRRTWPSHEAWTDATSQVGWGERVALREGAAGLEAFLNAPTRLDFGGIAKGVAVDEALAALADLGIASALMDGGGDLASLGPPPGMDGWKVEVRPFGDAPGAAALRFLLTRGAIATSGDAYQGAILGGVPPQGMQTVPQEVSSRFGHILNPRSLQPLPGPRAAVVTAPSATEADAFATTLVVIGDQAEGPARGGSLYEGLSDGVRSGIFFPSMESDPCVGDLFPHDGARLTTTLSARSTE